MRSVHILSLIWRRYANPHVVRYVSRHKNNQEEGNMKSQILGLRVAAIIFALVGLGHLLRVVTRADLLIAGHQIPIWPSVAGVVIAAALSSWMWRLAATAGRRP